VLEQEEKSTPTWLNRQITPVLQSLSLQACTHPIHTIVFIALLASTTYIGLLEGSLFDRKVGSLGTDWSSLVEGSRQLRIGKETGWKWDVVDNTAVEYGEEVRLLRRHY
jgi:hydroxymethylglutaryl-CoA reductase (NADPH)